MNFTNILLGQDQGLAIVTINRPKKLNALNKRTLEELYTALNMFEKDSSIKVIMITGSGEKAFVAGADISEFAHFNVEDGGKLAAKGQEIVFDFIENFSKPVIAAINGFALGGGLELAMACHFRVASENAKMGLPEVSLGVIPGYGGTQRLANLVGKGKAIEMITTASTLTSSEAKEWGLVNHVCNQEELISTAEKVASKIKKNSPMAIAKAIKSVNSGFITGVDGFEVEKKEFGSCFGTPEFLEGTTAFMEKRKPNFRGL